MSEFTNGQKGVELVGQEKWDEAIECLTKAIKVTKSPTWLLARAQAYQQKQELDRAMVDCEHAYLAAASRQSTNRNEQMINAQYRRGVVSFKQGRYADADACCVWAIRLALGRPAREQPDPVLERVGPDGIYRATVAEARADNPANEGSGEGAGAGQDLAAASKPKSWVRPYSFRSVALMALEKLPDDAPGRKLTVSRTPTPPELVNGEFGAKKPEAASGAAKSAAAPSATSSSAGAAAAPPPPKEQNLRFDFFQNKKVVTLSIFVKGVDKAQFAVEPVGSKTVLLRNIPRESNPNAVLALDHEIVPAETRHTVGATKIELTLTKANPGQNWGSWGSELTASDAAALAAASSSSSSAVPASAPTPAEEEEEEKQQTKQAAAPPPASSKPPAYPTSSKSGPKDWERLAGGEDDEESEDVDAFFKKLYKNAPPEAQRAMMKSYIESNGTELNTNWSDVKDRQVPVHPPDGVEPKKW